MEASGFQSVIGLQKFAINLIVMRMSRIYTFFKATITSCLPFFKSITLLADSSKEKNAMAALQESLGTKGK
jgi:hypothetical protein